MWSHYLQEIILAMPMQPLILHDLLPANITVLGSSHDLSTDTEVYVVYVGYLELSDELLKVLSNSLRVFSTEDLV